MPRKMHYISTPSELGAGTRGASLGCQALQMASLKEDRTFFKDHSVTVVSTENKRLHDENRFPHAIRIDGIAQMYQNIEQEVSRSLQGKNFPVVISGDHSNAGGAIAGIKAAHPDKHLGVIWIDAHADLHSPYTGPSGNVHGMPLATALHEDNLDNQINQPDEETIHHWNAMKGESQRVKPRDLFFIGLRDTEEAEDNLRTKYQIPNVTVEELRKKGVSEVSKQALNHLVDCDIIYISFDVDSMDPEVSEGTGTPVPGGLTEDEARKLLLELVAEPRLCCLEMTEINPLLDKKGNSMAEAAFRIFKPVVEKIERLGRKEGSS